MVDPLAVDRRVGADALRFALVHGSAAGADQRLGVTRLEGARNFANKLWNAARYVVNARPAEVEPGAELALPAPELLGPAEHWILERCATTIESVDRAYAEYQFGEVTRLLYDAIWSEYCDWYLEIAKSSLAADATADRRAATWRTLSYVLDRYLRLLHPVMPHITEQIWGRMPHRTTDPELLISAPWPVAEAEAVDRRLAGGVAQLIELVGQMRTTRAESGIAAGDWLPALIWLPEGATRDAYTALEGAIGRLARVRPTLVAQRAALDGRAGGGLAVVTPGAEARLTRSAADRARERDRLAKELRNIEVQLSATEARLGDESFVSRAPQPVVDQVRQRAVELREHAATLNARMEEA